MTSPALGIAYSLWLRLRWILAAELVLLTALALTVQSFPAAAPYCQMTSLVLIFLSLAPMLNACTYGPADLGVRAAGFPTQMMVLPLSTRSLVGWPMLYGAVIHASLWALLAILVFIPSGLQLPVFWPATLLAAICVWVQAIGWSPFSSPFVRVPALVIAITPLIVLPMWAGVQLPNSMVPILLMWRNIVVGVWPTLISRKWVSVAVAVNCMILFGVACLAGVWIFNHPEAQRQLSAFLPWIVGWLLAEKLFGAVAVGIALRQWDTIPANRLATLYAGWFLLAGLLFGAICCFVSPTWTIAAGVVLGLPFSRLAVMPLALHWNRHR
jgi:hypothetical protein